MNTQTEKKHIVETLEKPVETVNPMQERHIDSVEESVEATAEAVFTARRLEASAEQGRSSQKEAGPVFIP